MEAPAGNTVCRTKSANAGACCAKMPGCSCPMLLRVCKIAPRFGWEQILASSSLSISCWHNGSRFWRVSSGGRVLTNALHSIAPKMSESGISVSLDVLQCSPGFFEAISTESCTAQEKMISL